jgi:Na+-driven multidrug efflux pump
MTFRIDTDRGRRILSLALPIMIAMVTQTLINVVDTIYVGKLDPTYSIPGQAALGFSLPVYWSLGGFLAALGVGTQAITARRYGEGESEQAGQTLTNSLFVGFVASLAFTLIGWFGTPYAFEFLTSNESVLELGVPYTRVRMLAILPMTWTMAFKGFFDGLGKTRVHMWACLVMNTINILLNYPLIYGMGALPPMYVTGAGIASLIATGIGMFIMMGWTFRKEFREQFEYWKLSNLKPKLMGEVARLSAPSGAAEIFMMSGVLLFLKIVAMLDEQAVHTAIQATSAYAGDGGMLFAELQQKLATVGSWPGSLMASDWGPTVLSSRPPVYTTATKLIFDLATLGFVTCIAFGQATATLVSQHMGKDDYRQAEKYGWDSIKIGMYIFGVIGVIVILQPAFFLDILSDDPLVIEAAVPGLRVMGSLQMFVAAALILIQALFGSGNTKFVMYTEAAVHFLCLVPLAYLLAFTFEVGFMGVWLSAAAYVITLAGILTWKFWSGTWKTTEV